MSPSLFKVGDDVTVLRGSAGPAPIDRFAKIARVMARFVELDDGTRWDLDGSRPYPRRSGYTQPEIRLRRPDDDLAVRRRAALLTVALARPAAWEKLDLDTLEAIATKLKGLAEPPAPEPDNPSRGGRCRSTP